MPVRNRQTLKQYFGKGHKPTQADFENLIDSAVNILDDGISKDARQGLRLVPVEGNATVLSVYRRPEDEIPAWEISLDSRTGSLAVGRGGEGDSPTAVLHADGNIEIGHTDAVVTVPGTVASAGRRGAFAAGEVPADGRWHDLTAPLGGCWALEIAAGCGVKNTGRHAVVVATATHCFGARPRIRRTASHFGMRGNKIRLRWKKEGFACILQARTVFNYGPATGIRYHISRLWDPGYDEI
ncbi:MAG: hypothetical protein LIO85_05740 [Rikenellaceae bacterium]|nr:hypothetical protein [Rikenellaceae bacterium]